jgi:hypothetical protein
MPEKHPLPIDGAATTDADWPTLIERAVDDLARIVRSEAHMFQTRIEAALELQISRMVARLTLIAMLVSGALCILCAAIFLLHRWLPWWQAFGIAGLAVWLVGIASHVIMRPRERAGTSESK